MTEAEREANLREDLASLRIERGAARVRPSPRRGVRRWALTAVAVGAVAAVLVAVRAADRPVAVRVARAARLTAGGAALPTLSGSGYVVTRDRYVSIGVRVPGRIDRYFVEEGQRVVQGDALVQLDDRDYRAALAQAEAAYKVAQANRALAEAELARGEALRATAVISQQEFDVLKNKAEVARAAVAQADAELAQARVNLEYTMLRAPSDGVVLAKLKEVGEIAVPGGFAGSGDLIRLANMRELRAEVDVNEADLNRVQLGQPAEVTPDAYPDRRYAATVVKLYPQVDRQKGTLKVEVQILEPDAHLLPDMSARVSFLESVPGARADEGVLTVPAAAIRRDDAGDIFVWTVSDNRVRQTAVETAGSRGDQVRVAKGLAGGEIVVVSDDTGLREGRRVVVQSGG